MTVLSMDPSVIQHCVARASTFSDRGPVGLRAFADAFIEAHDAAWGGLSVEIGTRNGGSAHLFLELLSYLYPPVHRPMLWTVDPYGSKPYNGGDQDTAPIYTDINFVAMKKLLAPYPYHAHWMMTSGAFFDRMRNLAYWRPGQQTTTLKAVSDGSPVTLPVGEMRKASELTFCLLDGQHDAHTIECELGALFGGGGWMAPKGIVVVDNVNTDPKTRLMLDRGASIGMRCFQADVSANGEWAIVRAL